MSDSESAGMSGGETHTEALAWVERARRMVEYYPEACGFIQRASEHFPVDAEHAQILLRLWTEADILDALILPLLNELNSGLLRGQGSLDTTRGVSMQQSAPITLPITLDDGADGEEVVYECLWSLSWTAGCGVSVILSSNDSGILQVRARGSASSSGYRIGYPVTRSALEEALTMVYVSEATSV